MKKMRSSLHLSDSLFSFFVILYSGNNSCFENYVFFLSDLTKKNFSQYKTIDLFLENINNKKEKQTIVVLLTSSFLLQQKYEKNTKNITKEQILCMMSNTENTKSCQNSCWNFWESIRCGVFRVDSPLHRFSEVPKAILTKNIQNYRWKSTRINNFLYFFCCVWNHTYDLFFCSDFCVFLVFFL